MIILKDIEFQYPHGDFHLRIDKLKVPPDCKPVDVPLDPALAIGHRFGKLVEQNTDDA